MNDESDAHENRHPTDAVNNNGSIRFEGDFEIYDASGNKFDPTAAVSPVASPSRSAAAATATKSRFGIIRTK